MIAARFRLVGWVAGCAGAALLCYMASQSVAAERSALAKVDGEIASTKIDIDRLETEITARSRAGQVERWNGVLALQAARPAQYASSGVQLASMAGGRKLPLDPGIVASHGAVTTVAYQPAAAAPAPTAAPMPAAPKVAAPIVHAVADRPAVRPAPLLHPASYVRPAVGRLDGSNFLRASYEKPADRPIDAGMAPAKPEKVKPETSKAQTRPDTARAEKAQPKPAAVRPAVKLADPSPAKPKLKLARADKPEDALLPSDLGKLIAAERKPKAAKRAL